MYDCWSVLAVGVQQKAIITIVIIVVVLLHIIIGEAFLVFHNLPFCYKHYVVLIFSTIF